MHWFHMKCVLQIKGSKRVSKTRLQFLIAHPPEKLHSIYWFDSTTQCMFCNNGRAKWHWWTALNWNQKWENLPHQIKPTVS